MKKGMTLHTPQQNLGPILHRAAWLVPDGSAAIADGAVLTARGSVLDCGPYRHLKGVCGASVRQVDHGHAALMPALVNAHTHLELSALHGRIALPQESFRSWLQAILTQRRDLDAAAQQQGFQQGRQLLLQAGTGLYGDITNGSCLATDTPDPFPQRHTFLEVLGFDCEELATALPAEVLEEFSRGQTAGQTRSLAAHACYSTSAALIRRTHSWCRQQGLPFAIHTAEHADEIEFLGKGTGYCRQLLEALGREMNGWAPPHLTPVAYLDSLGVLDARTLLVHAVHLTDPDWETVAAKRCSVCFCPRSNHHLNVGRADIGKALQLGVTAALGTDSLASNTDLNMFSEAVFVLNHYPSISPTAVFAMMTAGGARALQSGNRFGSIAPGSAAALLAISLPADVGSQSSQLLETILHEGAKGAWQWVSHPTSN